MPTRQQLDEICNDIPIYFADEDGTPTGFLKEQAGTYTRSFLDGDKLFPVAVAKETLVDIQKKLLSEGYTMYMDGWSNYFYNESYYKAAQEMDKSGTLHLILGLAYELESWMDIDKNLVKSLEVQKYASEHVKTNWVKLFIDGTVETGTGFIEPLYTDGHQGISNWSEEEVTDITRKANEKGLTMHIHAMGNMAVNRAVNAYVNAGCEIRLCICVTSTRKIINEWQTTTFTLLKECSGIITPNMHKRQCLKSFRAKWQYMVIL